MALKLAFLGFNQEQTWRSFEELARENRGPRTRFYRVAGLLILDDGTEIHRISSPYPDSLRGRRYDQVILADDRRMNLLGYRRAEIRELSRCMAGSPIPEEFRWIVYDLDWQVGPSPHLWHPDPYKI